MKYALSRVFCSFAPLGCCCGVAAETRKRSWPKVNRRGERAHAHDLPLGRLGSGRARRLRLKHLRAIDETKGNVVLAERVRLAESPLRRLIGLMGKRSLPDGEGLLLNPCSSIHTCCMMFPIDAIGLDRDMRVVVIDSELRPWRIGSIRLRVRCVLELPAGVSVAADVDAGDQLRFETI